MKNKKSLAALALSLSLITSCATLDKKAIKQSYLENVGMLVQNSSLIYEDVFKYTKTGVEQFGAKELNPVAKSFQDKNKWNSLYLSAVGATILGNYLAYKADKSGTLAKVFNGTVALAEFLSIFTWTNLVSDDENLKREWKKRFPDVSATAIIFRINY